LRLTAQTLIWITAAKLEEANGNQDGVNRIIERALKSFAAQQLKQATDRDYWLKEAEDAEQAGYKMVSEAIIKNTLGSPLLSISLDDPFSHWNRRRRQEARLHRGRRSGRTFLKLGNKLVCWKGRDAVRASHVRPSVGFVPEQEGTVDEV
jgi:hypothetical protein